MNTLINILEKLHILETIGVLSVEVGNIAFDSRKVTIQSLFVAVKGISVDGHNYINSAIEKGAVAVICETLPTTILPQITYLKVDNTAKALGQVACNFYKNPSQKLKLVGITGTNGKTTTATLLYQLFSALGNRTGLISTVENKIGNLVLPAEFTTPDALAINELLAEMVDNQCEYVFMEVSSHAIHQHRIEGLHFTGGVFTNLSHDHLDYHKTFDEYIEAKKIFFDGLPKTAFAITNIDDRNGKVMVQNTKANIITYSLRTLADYKAKVIENSLSGLHINLAGYDFYSRLIGEFNVYNLLAVFAVAINLGTPEIETLAALSNLSGAEGRFDYIQDAKRNITAIVDFAHSPDALEKVLQTINKLKNAENKIITVVGCGGDRDKLKRPQMAKTACRYSNHVILTSDNPRSEQPEAIISDMEQGVLNEDKPKTIAITDRKTAIHTACKIAQIGDIVLVAGKGHEKYQEINGIKYPFDDKAILKEYLV
ncbi:MAG: UDP-N-acetylmuramoyl-L-alanyl-D-glutamate--2,6-diaminopimelate ligase [Saprospiraceae bacterium]|nr:UDP-N-acetylmuramoyl-L-alanyl-D-glutamate--2,6-diaminopimelate ligase [Saprospiraceae bacterium]